MQNYHFPGEFCLSVQILLPDAIVVSVAQINSQKFLRVRMFLTWTQKSHIKISVCYQFKSSCAQCFKRPIFKTSEFGVRKGLLIKRLQFEKIRALGVLQMHLKKSLEFRLLYVKRQ